MPPIPASIFNCQFVSSSVRQLESRGQYAPVSLFQKSIHSKKQNGPILYFVSEPARVFLLLCDALVLEPHDARAYSQGGAQCGENGQQALHHKFPDFLLSHSRFVSFLFYFGLSFSLISFLSFQAFLPFQKSFPFLSDASDKLSFFPSFLPFRKPFFRKPYFSVLTSLSQMLPDSFLSFFRAFLPFQKSFLSFGCFRQVLFLLSFLPFQKTFLLEALFFSFNLSLRCFRRVFFLSSKLSSFSEKFSLSFGCFR